MRIPDERRCSDRLRLTPLESSVRCAFKDDMLVLTTSPIIPLLLL
jgi:hypothetical protein